MQAFLALLERQGMAIAYPQALHDQVRVHEVML